MKKIKIIGVILLIISIGLVIYKEFINPPVNIYTITNSGSEKEDAKVYLNATFVAGTITGNDNDSYYVMFGDGVQYIVHINNAKANKINRYLLDNPDSSYKIRGITKLIPKDMVENGRKFVKEWLDNNHNHSGEEDKNHTHDITEDDFYHYFGYVYLEEANFDIIKLIIYITGITGLLIVLYAINTKYHFIGD